MNYLAHIFLSHEIGEVLVGNFIADFIRNKEVQLLSEDQINGVLLHRHIDAFTDIHPVVRNSCKIFRKDHGKYAPVLVDIIYDYILVKNWDIYMDKPLSAFKEINYKLLLHHSESIPNRAQAKLSAMVHGDFISSYESLNGLGYVMKRMDARTRFPSQFQNALLTIQENEDELSAQFNRFFPEMIEKSKGFLKGLHY